ncbi:RNA 2',3'-cyclic phosphodiesterase [Streptomyces gilvosporeus]|uniref:RNA 2',3'-cyclic phosphodiesterase n=1 Tax=Streptomyces gilvosporeus TaxID=553510 RepID=A0A1V0TVG1_9ACTN|nr:RNA 2',3'-cyclic phosphodiesterase [Streptomyces gilvosporeus]ARF56945.1 2'-5' RNA ligase [Streptomyces gilvosporeus]
MRLFAAVLPPGSVLTELSAAVARLKALPEADRLRWTGHEGWHFTLAFYGEVADDLLPELAERLARAARRQAPYELRIMDGGRFDDRVVWVGAEGELEVMRKLADSAEAAGRRAGVTRDSHRTHRPYHPHLTIARNRIERLHLAPFADGLDGFESSPWTVRELALMRSHPPTPGVRGSQPHYEKLASWPLGH